MRFATRIGLALLVVASMGIVVGSSGFSSTEADRSVSVTIVEDEDAYVGLDYDEEIAVYYTDRNKDRSQNVNNYSATYQNASVVMNQFTEDITVTVEVIDETGYPKAEFRHAKTGANEAEVPVGDTAVFDAEVRCKKDGREKYKPRNVTVQYHVEGDGVSATVERHVRISCGKVDNSNSGSS